MLYYAMKPDGFQAINTRILILQEGGCREKIKIDRKEWLW